jgi:hypothetical protein
LVLVVGCLVFVLGFDTLLLLVPAVLAVDSRSVLAVQNLLLVVAATLLVVAVVLALFIVIAVDRPIVGPAPCSRF